MATVNMTLAQVEDILYEAVRMALELPENSRAIRFPFGSDPENEDAEPGSAPDFRPTDNVCFIYVFPDEDGYGTQTHTSYRDDGAEKLTEINEQTAVHRVNFVCYGPKASQWTRTLKVALVRQDIREYLQKNHFSFVSHSLRETRAPEKHEGVWWNRWDLAGQFYALVRIETEDSVSYIESVRINPTTERSI